MAPTQTLENAQQLAASEQQQPTVEMQAVTAQQPGANQPMSKSRRVAVTPVRNALLTRVVDPGAPHDESQISLRGGERSGLCPGRFCFCIPCCLPCDFCII
jgi:hypothetical protein